MSLRDVPNLDWLRVFVACADTESFVLAADQLGVTAGAVSQRVKTLEGFVGVPLFHRHAQGVRLTDAGKHYAQSIRAPLSQLEAATHALRSAGSVPPIRLTILPALAQLWLGPRLETFHQRHEGASVEIWADPTVIDLRTSTFDLAIRYGRPPFPGCDHRELLFDELVPVASPDLAASAGLDKWGFPIGASLMVDTYWSNDLDVWLQQTGGKRPPDLAVQNFSLYSMAVEAVLNRRGFMIGHTSLVSDLVDQGRLVYLSEKRVTSAHQFYLLTRSSTPLSSSTAAFIDWIVEQ